MEDSKKIEETLNHLFRHESGRMVSVLVKIFGTENYELAEDVVQDALLHAMEKWKYGDIPASPKSWLYKTAKNKAIDILRREKHAQNIDFTEPERKLLTSEYTLASTVDEYWQDESIKDDFLAMMYACCHPAISEEGQTTFILKALCGFSTKEIARAFLIEEQTISKRLYRTKEFFRSKKLKPEIPPKSELRFKTKSILNTIYLIFNEGYNSTHSNLLIREDLIQQAMFLCKSLIENDKTMLPETYALMALMCFHAARSQARISNDGSLINLAKQDRSKWIFELIKSGNDYLNKSAFGDKISSYHIEAAIAYEHCTAKTFELTNWEAIIKSYDTLFKLYPDPIVWLNRCIAILEHKGPMAALDSMISVKDHKTLDNYYIYHSTLGEIFSRLGEKEKAIECFRKAKQLTISKIEQRYLNDRISVVEGS